MTKKSGLFDVDFSFTTKELSASVKGEQVSGIQRALQKHYRRL